jgi:hypothetical protein
MDTGNDDEEQEPTWDYDYMKVYKTSEDINDLRKHFFHTLLVHAGLSSDMSFFDMLIDIIRSHGLTVRPDLDMVLGLTTGGHRYLKTDCDLCKAAVVIAAATEDQLITFMPKPRDISKGYKKRHQQFMTAVSNLKAAQDSNQRLA